MSWPQQRLDLWPEPARTRESFIVSAANAEAVARVDGWPAWPGGALALVGPPASGKSHLASAWAARAGASRAAEGPVLVEDADRLGDDERLFHLLTGAEARRGVLLTARAAPRDWPHGLADLRSRLAALPVAEIAPPDDALLAKVLARLLAAVGVRPEPDVVPYLVARMGRSLAEAKALAAALDSRAAALRRPVTRALAREVLEERGASGRLFG